MRRLQRSAGSGSGQPTGYRVEARVKELAGMPMSPIEIGGRQTLTHEWQEIHFKEGMNPAGVPSDDGSGMWRPGNEHRMLPYDSALALAWTLIAQNRHRSIECRLVRYQIKYSYTIEYQGYVDGLDLSSRFFERPVIIDDTEDSK